MKRLLALVVMIALWPLSLEAQSKEAGRLHNAGTVMGEILNVPDDIPQQLLDKAECVIVIPRSSSSHSYLAEAMAAA